MIKINISLEESRVKYSDRHDGAVAFMQQLRRDEEDFTGWVNWPSEIPSEWMDGMKRAAEDIRSKCDKLIVIGIGGSYLGTAAVLEALGGSKPGCPEILYAGNNMSGYYLHIFIFSVTVS